jgi:hypothetical protein
MLKRIFNSSTLFFALILVSDSNAQPYNSWDEEKIEVHKPNDISIIMDASQLYRDRWDELAQPNFWKQIMRLSPDSCLINVADTRVVLSRMSIADWSKQSEAQKEFSRIACAAFMASRVMKKYLSLLVKTSSTASMMCIINCLAV